MTSLLTNVAALSSLRALGATQSQLSRTQAQISSGLAIATASDGAAYWSIAQTMSAQVAGLRAVNQGLSMTMSIADVTAVALNSIKTSLDKIKADIVVAQQSGISLPAVQSDIVAQQQSIIAVANSASFNGVNWLINRISRTEKNTTVITVDVPKKDYQSILLGQDPGRTSTFDSTQTIDDSVDVNGTTSSSETTSGYHVTTTDPSSGPPVTMSVYHESSTPGSVASSAPGDVNVPMSDTATGSLVTSPFSLIPLCLFSDSTGSVTNTVTVTIGGVNDAADSSGPTTTTTTSQSYDGGGVAYSGILDAGFTVSSAGTGTSAESASSNPGAPSLTFTIPFTGGTFSPNTPSTSGAPPSTNTVRESILTMNVIGATAADLAVMGSGLDTALTGIMGASTAIGALQSQMSTMSTFNSAMADTLTSGVGSLVDADMNVASTRLQALQTQQQLGIQALSIANQDGQLLLKLFEAA